MDSHCLDDKEKGDSVGELLQVGSPFLQSS